MLVPGLCQNGDPFEMSLIGAMMLLGFFKWEESDEGNHTVSPCPDVNQGPCAYGNG